MRGKKTSVAIKAKVIESRINNPNKSSRDIASELGGAVSNDTVCDIINNDLPQVATESQAVASLIDRNNSLQSAGDALIAEMIADKADGITIAQLTTLRQSTFTQNQILTGKPTDIHKFEGIKEITIE